MAFCTTCGRPVADGVINCGICDPRQQQQVIVAPPKRRTSPVTWLALPLVVLFAIAAIIAMVQSAKEAQAPPVEKPCLAAETVLYGWQHGVNLPSEWTGGTEREALFAVTAYNQVGQTVGAGRAVCSFRVHSSTRGGFPIVADWNLYTARRRDAEKYKVDDRWKVTRIERAQ